jgi:diguanylate cyclase (GGDEF)-like protein/PAS domain S-box-containing protein
MFGPAIEATFSRLSFLRPGLISFILSFGITLVAVVAAYLVAELTFPLLASVDFVQVRLAVLVTSALVAAPIAWGVVKAAVSVWQEKQHLGIRDELLGAAQHYAKQGTWELDIASGRFVLSDALHQLLGDPDKQLQLTAALLMEMVNPADRERLATALERVQQEGSQEQIEYRITGVDGKERTFWVTGTRQLGAGGKPVKAFGISQDITDRKAAEEALRDSEDHYRHAVELSPQMPWTADPQGNILDVSPQWEALTGLTRERSIGAGWMAALHPDDLEPTKRVWKDALRSDECNTDTEYRLQLTHGSYRWFRARAAARQDSTGQIMCWYGTTEDIHDRKTAEIALRESEHALRESEAFATSILDSTVNCLRVLDLEGRVQYINKPGLLALEIDDFSSVHGLEWPKLWPEETRPMLENALAAAKSGGVGRFAGLGLTAKGTPKWWDVSVSPIPGADGRTARLLVISTDRTAEKLAQDELERARSAAEVAAYTDSLTGLFNRSYFRQRLEEHLRQTSPSSQTALLFLDLDEFKSVNDSLGHPAGDELLKQAGARLQDSLRDTDLIARFGGDEFAILQAAVEDPEQTGSLAQRVITRLSEPYYVGGEAIAVGVSVGIAVASAPTASADDLLKGADIALYEAKHAGKGIYRVFVPGMDQSAEERQRLRSELREAIARGEFRVVYQPIIEFESTCVTGFEALLRWKHPRRGLLNPLEFIPLAEATGDILVIGAWVLREACSMAATWPGEMSVSVNLSPRQITGADLKETVSQALVASGLPAQRLMLEITESVLLQDNELVQETLEWLRSLGVRISIDDFGTGYSSLGYLRRFSVDNIKIDRNFVADLSGNTKASGMLEALVVLAGALGVSLTAEGIETAAQLEKLKGMGCHFGQGFLLGRPVAADQLSRYMIHEDAA